MLDDPINIGIGALGALALSFAGRWIGSARVRGGVQGGQASGPHESGVDARGLSDRTGGVPGAGEPDVPAAPSPEPEPPRLLIMGAKDHVREFLAWMLEDDVPLEFTSKRLAQQYAGWTRERRLVPLPESIFLAQLAKHPLVTRRRGPRRRDAEGKVMRTASGTEIRDTLYRLEPRADAKLPGKVPVAEVVAQVPVAPRMKRAA